MNLPRLRPALAGIPTYRPGRSAAGLVKLSSNENPFPPLPAVLERATNAAATMNRYPDLFATDLVAEISRHLGVSTAEVAVGPGSVGVLQQILQSVAQTGDEVVYPWRSFEAYPILVQICGATGVPVPLTADGRHDLTAMADAVTERTRLIMVCSPNNPTGTVIGHQELMTFLRRVPSDVLIVIDEAYIEFNRDATATDGLALFADHANICLLRTFSKAYGLAGLRVGYGLAHEPLATMLRACAIPFGVSAIAQAAAVQSLREQDELGVRVNTTVTERTRLRDALLEQGWVVPQTEANFVWLPLGSDTLAFAAACEQADLLVRPFPGEGCRITVGDREANDAVVQVAKHWSQRARWEHPE